MLRGNFHRLKWLALALLVLFVAFLLARSRLDGGASVPASRLVSSLAPPIEWRAPPNRLISNCSNVD
jgi:hypothetical protein